MAREIERLNPGVSVELVGIDTRGDKILDVPLGAIEGKEFFVAELDQALREKRVDFTVHSLKDLSLERPPEFMLAAIPPRENPRDALLAGPLLMEHIRKGRKLRIGTSSPRRLENLPALLRKLLPVVDGRRAEFEFVEIRGNVNTRLARVHQGPRSAKYLDAVVLALAGLNRLWMDSDGQKQLGKLMRDVRWMMLPLRECPTAPGQGALAVECRAVDKDLLSVLKKIHDGTTAAHIARERAQLAEWGGGCHQRFGATAISHPELTELFFVKGVTSKGMRVDELRWSRPGTPSPGVGVRPWDGSHFKARYEDILHDVSVGAFSSGKSGTSGCVFVAHSRAARAGMPRMLDALARARVWTSGVPSWQRLAEMGIWVEGCAESRGFEEMRSTISTPVLGLAPLDRWTVLTHESAVEDWRGVGVGKTMATYRARGAELSSESEQELRQATHLYWSSGSQFERLFEFTARTATHACGPGKTLMSLRAEGLSPLVFPSAEEWRKWVGI